MEVCHFRFEPIFQTNAKATKQTTAITTTPIHSFILTFIHTPTMSFVADVMAPGGGILLLPFVRVVISLLLVCTVGIFIAGVARIHMAILSFLSTGLLFSLWMFENAYNNMKNRGESAKPPVDMSSKQNAGKTD